MTGVLEPLEVWWKSSHKSHSVVCRCRCYLMTSLCLTTWPCGNSGSLTGLGRYCEHSWHRLKTSNRHTHSKCHIPGSVIVKTCKFCSAASLSVVWGVMESSAYYHYTVLKCWHAVNCFVMADWWCYPMPFLESSKSVLSLPVIHTSWE